MSSAVFVSSNGSASHAPDDWRQQSVRQFFSAFNWEDHPPEVQIELAKSQEGDQPLSLLLTVQQFFGAINWDGNAIASTPSMTEELPSAGPGVDAFTLDDFSDLF